MGLHVSSVKHSYWIFVCILFIVCFYSTVVYILAIRSPVQPQEETNPSGVASERVSAIKILPNQICRAKGSCCCFFFFSHIFFIVSLVFGKWSRSWISNHLKSARHWQRCKIVIIWTDTSTKPDRNYLPSFPGLKVPKAKCHLVPLDSRKSIHLANTQWKALKLCSLHQK